MYAVKEEPRGHGFITPMRNKVTIGNENLRAINPVHHTNDGLWVRLRGHAEQCLIKLHLTLSANGG